MMEKKAREWRRGREGGKSGVKPSTDFLLLLFNPTLESYLKFKTPFCVRKYLYTRCHKYCPKGAASSPADLPRSTGTSRIGRTCAYIHWVYKTHINYECHLYG